MVMTSWFEKGRPALFKALDAVCQQIDQDLTAELQQRQLQHDPEPAGEESDAPKQRRTVDSDIGYRSGQDGRLGAKQGAQSFTKKKEDLKHEYAKLSAQYKLLNKNFKEARQALEKRKEERDRWSRHAEYLERKIKAAEQQHGIHILDRGARQEEIADLPTADALTGDQKSIRLVSEAEPEPQDVPITNHAEAQPTRNGYDSPEQELPGSTQGDSEERLDTTLPPLPTNDVAEVKIEEEPSSDGAVFISERCIKKRRLNSEAPATPAHTRIKTEPAEEGSSPELSLHHCDFNPHESLDLGATNAATYTPRKRKELEQSQVQGVRPDTPGQELTANSVEKATNSPRPAGFSSALTPVDVNRRLARPALESKSESKPLRKDLGRGIATLAEDGALYARVTHQTPATTSKAKPHVGSRLSTLLNSPSVSEDETPIRPNRRRNQNSAAPSREELAIPGPRTLPFEKGDRSVAKTSNTHAAQPPRATPGNASAANQNRKTPQARAPSKSLLRNKPLSQLKLDDFKINPSVNEGHDFAYSEVVRDKDERACLPGCVDMHCCGKQFRALALSQRPDPPLTAAQRQEEQKLLEEYLGDYAYRLATITKEERLELWIDAKTRELANKYGRHRHRFSRMRSPPGFWNADFPSTQELEENKAEAAKRERQSVQERYREAMRPGGRWIFRDE